MNFIKLGIIMLLIIIWEFIYQELIYKYHLIGFASGMGTILIPVAVIFIIYGNKLKELFK